MSLAGMIHDDLVGLAYVAAMMGIFGLIAVWLAVIGIYSVMSYYVHERTREIGIRMALGARPRDILRQFLVESVVLSSIGGAIGLGLGIGASAGISKLVNAFLPSMKWPLTISLPAGIVALLFAAAVGIFFGYYPARRASRLDPIEALRYD